MLHSKSILSFVLVLFISGCSSVVLPIDERALINDIKAKYQGEILAPEDLKKGDITTYSFPPVWGFNVRSYFSRDGSFSLDREFYRFKNEDRGSTIFEHFIESEGDIEKTGRQIILKNRIAYRKYDSSSDLNYLSTFKECEFKLGTCTYKSASGKDKKVKTYFENGVWTSEYEGFRNSKLIETKIYHKSGLLIFSSYKGLIRGNTSYSNREAFEANSL
ncbi:hypothetical protein J7384_18555 [Endozoicomonas sp. G2_1]|uniref:hypothetical protein n=1 Tax=Endozoicomonas sp. G2_1 TaxID=2821091 RepID=UPI001AD9721D|nr:hypothetical protein [Endozoicomonas sp. G2_1]MBO9492370.1 hypothetical protein [Endozoicomonas sp. G2_1]